MAQQAVFMAISDAYINITHDARFAIDKALCVVIHNEPLCI